MKLNPKDNMYFISEQDKEFLSKIEDNVKKLNKYLNDRSLSYETIIEDCDLCEKKLVQTNNKIVNNLTDHKVISSEEYANYESNILAITNELLKIKGLAEQKIELRNYRQRE